MGDSRRKKKMQLFRSRWIVLKFIEDLPRWQGHIGSICNMLHQCKQEFQHFVATWESTMEKFLLVELHIQPNPSTCSCWIWQKRGGTMGSVVVVCELDGSGRRRLLKECMYYWEYKRRRKNTNRSCWVDNDQCYKCNTQNAFVSCIDHWW